MKNRVRELRTQRNWTQQEMADRIDVSRQTINAIETGRCNGQRLCAEAYWRPNFPGKPRGS
jgi:DNA-binding XRE family transcriptional regulator